MDRPINILRRTFLGGVAASGLWAGTANAFILHGGPSSSAPPPPSGNLVATITFPGGSPAGGPFTYDMSTGTDIGSYTSSIGGFTQRCIRVRNVGIANYFVDFRPDTVGGRVEVVFWNGECDPDNTTIASGHIRDLPSYTVTITNGGTSIYSATIPYHYWATRWRYKSSDRPVIRSASQIYGNFFPTMSLTAARLSGNNLSTGKAWSGLPYSTSPYNVIQPVAPEVISSTYTPFMAPDTTAPGGGTQPNTTLASPASGGATTITVTSNTAFLGLLGGEFHLTIQLANGTYFTTVVSASSSGTTWTLNLPLPSAANSGATVYNGEWKLGLVLYIETGGERAELGAMTEWAADYLLNGTSSSLNALRQHAEMSCSEWPFFLSDVTTKAPINFKRSLGTYTSYIGTNPIYNSRYLAAFTDQSNGWDFHETDAHFQMHPFIAWALTEDAYFLEGCQYLQAYGIGNVGTMLGREGNATSSHGQIGWGDLLGTPAGTNGINGTYTNCSYYNEIRSQGNGARNLGMAYKVSQSSPPSWLNAQSVYSAYSQDYLKVVDTLWTQGANNLQSVFYQISFDPFWQAFEMAYAIMGMSLCDLYSLPSNGGISWLTTLTHYFNFFTNLTNGTSGWNNQTPQPHDIQNNASPEVPASGQLNFQNYNTWGALYTAAASFVQNGATFPTQASPGNQQGGSMGNCNMIYAACAMAKSRGVSAGTAAKSYMDTFIDYNYPNNADASMGIPMEMKCGFTGT